MSNIFKVGIDQLTGTTTVTDGRGTGSGDPKIHKPRIMSIGGCVTDVICNRLSRLADTSHIWRITVPCLMSRAVDGRSYYKASNPQVSERINFELTKQPLRKLESGGFDLLIFDPTSDFNNDYFEKDGCVINNITSGRLGEGWTWPEGFIEAGWNRLDPCSHRYIDLYVHHLTRLIELSERIGVPIIMLKRMLCTNKVDRHGLSSLGDPVSAEANWWIDLLWSKIAGIKGVSVLELDGRYSITSFDAPWGESRFHPIDEFYDYAIYKLMYMMGLSDDLISDVMVDVYKGRAIHRHAIQCEREELARERDGMRNTVSQLTSERDALVGELNDMRVALSNLTRARDVLADERDGMRASLEPVASERDALLRECESLRGAVAGLKTERDASVADREAIRNANEQLTAEREHERAFLAQACASDALGAYSLNEIVRLDDRSLIRAVFKAFIGREPMRADMERYLALLFKNRPKLVVIGAILRECGVETAAAQGAISNDVEIALQAHRRWKSVPFSYLGYRVGWQRNR